LRSRILLEGRKFSEQDFIDTFLSSLKGEIKPFVQAFKPKSLAEALEYSLYMECAVDNQIGRLKSYTRHNNLPVNSMAKPTLTSKPIPFPSPTKNNLIEQRRALE